MSNLCSTLLPQIIRDFGKCWECRPRGDSIEVITPFGTSTDSFVSVFITKRDKHYIVTDGGWLENRAEAYGLSLPAEELDWQLAVEHFSQAFTISQFETHNTTYYFKTVESEQMLSSAVFDVSSFVGAVINALSVPKEERGEVEHKETFRVQANGFFRAHFPEAGFRRPLKDLHGATFSVVIERRNRLSLVNFVTGSTPHYFGTDMRRAIVNFELAKKSKYRDVIRSQVALINNEAAGYSPLATQDLMSLLGEKSSHPPVLWTDRSQILDLVS